MKSAVCLHSAVCFPLALLWDLASLMQYKVVRYENLEFFIRAAVCLLSAVCLFLAELWDLTSLIQYKVVRYENLGVLLFTFNYILRLSPLMEPPSPQSPFAWSRRSPREFPSCFPQSLELNLSRCIYRVSNRGEFTLPIF